MDTDLTKREMRKAAGLPHNANNKDTNAAYWAAELIYTCEKRFVDKVAHTQGRAAANEAWGKFDHLLPKVTRQLIALIDEDEKRKPPSYRLTLKGPPDPIIPHDCWEAMHMFDPGITIETMLG